MKKLTFGTFASGIESTTLAWQDMFDPVFYSEIKPEACTLLNHYYPNTPNLGDMTKINNVPTVDIIAGGTPCQSFSNAGEGKGLADPRGQLAIKFFELAKQSGSRWVVWENVPGALNKDKGRAFASIIREMGERGYGYAYRVLNAKHFGVPQRRRRIFLVGFLGDWRPAAAVLFERPGKERDYKTTTRQYPTLDESTFGRKWQSNQWVRNGYAIADRFGIRRLTPIEGERLMGMPDNYTKVPGIAESKRYGLIGNSIPVPVIKWIGERISLVENILANP